MRRAATVALGLVLALGAALPVLAADRVAVSSFQFSDGSGEVRDQRAEHAANLALFNDALRAGLSARGLDVVVPDCGGPCSPDEAQFEAMAEATRALDAKLLMIGGLRKVSTLIGLINVTLIDVTTGKVVCNRSLSYRGDNAEAWTRAADFTAMDVMRGCFGAPAS